MGVLKEYYKGLPCMMGEVVGRIVGEAENGSWNYINNLRVYSIPLFSTPHGTVFKVGFLKLSEISEEGKQRLVKYEENIKANNDESYAGLLN